ncbi:MAG: polysaccharide deacetylase family protein [Actinobacteria bacterium]|nr:polysaccharide deacetylase family protein [Actinomycetota bacterium]MBV8561742.1 polysaccharide deacetylase family protein [Actinomycetota bacterium]
MISRAVLASVLAAGALTAGTPLRLPAQLPTRTVDVPILMYHLVGRVPRFADGPYTRGLTVAPQLFADEMEWLSRNGFHAITQLQLLGALEYGKPLPSRPVMITFDDGYRDVLYYAAPVLRRLHMPATAYVITDRVMGHDPSFLDWGGLRALEHDGFTIGSHTVHHVDLTLLTRKDAWHELFDSRRILSRGLGRPVDWFAYPAGRENPKVVRLVRDAGYLLAVTTRPGVVQSARHPFLLRRDEILGSLGIASFAALLHSSG